MRGHRLLFVLASLFALGLIGFANFPGDRDAVPDTEASRLVGGICLSIYDSYNCNGNCSGMFLSGLCTSAGDSESTNSYCGCGGTACGKNYNGCTNG